MTRTTRPLPTPPSALRGMRAKQMVLSRPHLRQDGPAVAEGGSRSSLQRELPESDQPGAWP